jgi:cholesterol transport system auxiliary component
MTRTSPVLSCLFRRIVAAAWVTLVLAGCGGLQLQPRQLAVYDLGLGERSMLSPALATELAPAQIVFVTPPWLESDAMQYRLAWSDPARRRAFAESRWVSAPASMLELVLERTLRPDAASGRCRLRVDLDEFVQVFSTAERSEIRIVLRAGLLPPRSDLALATREFGLVEPAPSANASGGARAFRVGAQRLGAELSDWISTLDRELGGGLNAQGRCGGRTAPTNNNQHK